MLKYCLLVLIMVGQVFAVGLKPSFDLGFGATKYTWTEEWDGDKVSENFTTLRLGTELPFSRVIGVTINILSFTFLDEGTVTAIGNGGFSSFTGIGGFSSTLGLIEQLPISPVAPFFKQYIMIYKISEDEGWTATYTDIGIGLGVEILSQYKIKPILEGYFSTGSEGFGGDGDDDSISHNSYGFGFSIKYDL